MLKVTVLFALATSCLLGSGHAASTGLCKNLATGGSTPLAFPSTFAKTGARITFSIDADCNIKANGTFKASTSIDNGGPPCVPSGFNGEQTCSGVAGTALCGKSKCPQAVSETLDLTVMMDVCTPKFVASGTGKLEMKTEITGFNQELSADITVSKEMSPANAAVPIAGVSTINGPLQLMLGLGQDTGFTGANDNATGKPQFRFSLRLYLHVELPAGISLSFLDDKTIFETNYVTLTGVTNPACASVGPAPAEPFVCKCIGTTGNCTTIATACAINGGSVTGTCSATANTCTSPASKAGTSADCTDACKSAQYTSGEATGVKNTDSGSSSTCFPASSKVQLADGSALTMAAVQVGHKVRVGPKEHSEIFMFSHQYTDAQATFLQLQTATGAIQLTESHYLYVNGKAAQASTVKIGDLLETANGTPDAVTTITTVRATGLYNPHTIQGDIIVNGFRTTTYTDAINPTLAHALLAPIRAMYAMNVTVA